MLSDLISKLKNANNLDDKLKVIEKIKDLGELAKPATQEFINLLDTKTPQLCVAAAEILAKLKETSVISTLLAIVTNEQLSSNFRKKIIATLPLFKDPCIIPKLVPLLQDTNVYVCNETVKALNKFKKDPSIIPILTNALTNSKPLIQKNILKRLLSSKNPNLIPFFIHILKQPEEKLFDNLANELYSYKYNNLINNIISYGEPFLLDHLFLALENKSDSKKAIYSVIRLIVQFPSETLLPKLVNLLKHSKEAMRYQAAFMLKDLDPEMVVSPLIAALSKPSTNAHYEIRCALEQISNIQLDKSEEANLIDSLINSLKEGTWDFRLTHIVTHISGDSFKTLFINKLLEIFPSSDNTVQEEIVRLLPQIASSEASSILSTMLKQASSKVKSLINKTLKSLKISTSAVPELIQLLDTSDEDIRNDVISKLVESQDPRAIPPLIKLFNKRGKKEFYEVIEALSKFSDASTINTVYKQVTNPQYNPSYILRLLSENPSKEASLAILEALKHTNAEVRESAVEYIYNIGHLSQREKINTLIELLKDENYKVRERVTRDLARFDIPAEESEPERLIILVAKLQYNKDKRVIELIIKHRNRVTALMNLIDEFIKLAKEIKSTSYELAPLVVGDRFCLLAKKSKQMVLEITETKAKTYVLQLTEILEKSSNVFIKEQTLKILGEFSIIGDLAITQTLRAMLKDKSEFLRFATVKTLTKFKDTSLIADLAKIAEQDESKRVRISAIHGLKSLGWQPI